MSQKIEHCMCEACKDGNLHWPDCAVHNMPAYPNGSCDCGDISDAYAIAGGLKSPTPEEP